MKRVMNAAAVIMFLAVLVLGCKPDEPVDHSGSLNGHDYVDLGLPSGTLWATCNVGADTPEGYGDYFSWGETAPKTIYNWSSYQYCKGNADQLTKYCSKVDYGYNGFKDNLTILSSDDDAATANWGSGWCMPTKAQWEELYYNTTNIWTTQNGVRGRLFTAGFDHSLFLPAAGGYWDDDLYMVGHDGCYWSRSLRSDEPNNAWGFYMNTDYYSASNYFYRGSGRSVRPVRSSH